MKPGVGPGAPATDFAPSIWSDDGKRAVVREHVSKPVVVINPFVD
jgi:hypothetical protein